MKETNVMDRLLNRMCVKLGLLAAVFATGQTTDASTEAYWKMDDWTGRKVLRDAVGNHDLVSWHHTQSAQGFSCADPIPNPDSGPFLEGFMDENPRSCATVRANTYGPVDAFNMTGEESWTIEGWCYWEGNTGNAFLVGTRSKEAADGDGWELFIVGHNSATAPGRLEFRMISGGAMAFSCNSGTEFIQLNNWHHIALVWDHDDGQHGTVSLYLDGVLVGLVFVASAFDDSEAKVFYVGGRDWSADGVYRYTEWGFSGYLDEWRFSRRALKPEQFLNANLRK